MTAGRDVIAIRAVEPAFYAKGSTTGASWGPQGTASRVAHSDALAVLRGYAFAHQTTLDVVAADLTSQHLTAEDLVN